MRNQQRGVATPPPKLSPNQSLIRCVTLLYTQRHMQGAYPLYNSAMTVEITELDAHEQPSEELKAQWKSYSKTEQKDLIDSGEIDDLECAEKTAEFCLAGTIPAERLNTSFKHITPPGSTPVQVDKDAPIYYHPLLPGQFSHTQVLIQTRNTI